MSADEAFVLHERLRAASVDVIWSMVVAALSLQPSTRDAHTAVAVDALMNLGIGISEIEASAARHNAQYAVITSHLSGDQK